MPYHVRVYLYLCPHSDSRSYVETWVNQQAAEPGRECGTWFGNRRRVYTYLRGWVCKKRKGESDLEAPWES